MNEDQKKTAAEKVEPHTVTVFELRADVQRLEAQNANFRQANEAKHVEIAEMDRRHVARVSELENDAAELRNRLEAYQVNSEDVIRDKQSKIEILQYELDVQKALVKALKEVFTLKI
jgi:hypothetical protein